MSTKKGAGRLLDSKEAVMRRCESTENMVLSWRSGVTVVRSGAATYSKAFSPVMSRPRISVCTSKVPS